MNIFNKTASVLLNILYRRSAPLKLSQTVLINKLIVLLLLTSIIVIEERTY